MITVSPAPSSARRHVKPSVVKTVEQRQRSPFHQLNLCEQKEKFLNFGIEPQFVLKGPQCEIDKITSKPKAQIRFDHFKEAACILNTVREKYGDGKDYVDTVYGARIDKTRATEIMMTYLEENYLDGAISIFWCSDLPCSARMVSTGPLLRHNKPELRKYSMWVNDSASNMFLSELGIICLVDHEIGTHYFRMFNDGFQPWFSDRKRFDLPSLNSSELLDTEEGLASIHMTLRLKIRYLWKAALLYYTACKAAEMAFRPLFDHLERFVADPEQRWRHVVRAKRGISDPSLKPGGYGKDQCYFAGAVEILRDIENIDFNLLISGKICKDDLSRVKRLARTDIVRIPVFMRDIVKYKRNLRHIARVNGLIEKPVPRSLTLDPPNIDEKLRKVAQDIVSTTSLRDNVIKDTTSERTLHSSERKRNSAKSKTGNKPRSNSYSQSYPYVPEKGCSSSSGSTGQSVQQLSKQLPYRYQALTAVDVSSLEQVKCIEKRRTCDYCKEGFMEGAGGFIYPESPGNLLCENERCDCANATSFIEAQEQMAAVCLKPISSIPAKRKNTPPKKQSRSKSNVKKKVAIVSCQSITDTLEKQLCLKYEKNTRINSNGDRKKRRNSYHNVCKGTTTQHKVTTDWCTTQPTYISDACQIHKINSETKSVKFTL